MSVLIAAAFWPVKKIPLSTSLSVWICYNKSMIKKILKRTHLTGSSSPDEDLKYWLRRPVKDRVVAVEILRNQAYGRSARLQRVARVIQRPSR